MPHPDAPFRTRQANVFSAAEIIDISDSSAWLQDFYDRNERIDIAACDDCTVNTSSTSQFQNLPIDGAIFIADEIGSTVLSRCIYADGPRSDCEDSGCAAERCPCHRHQSDRADADYEHGITKLYVCEFCAVKTGRHHVREHAGFHNVHTLRQMRQIAVGVVYMEIFRKYAVLDI